MKINIFLSLVSVILAALIGYLIVNIASRDDYGIICGVGSGLCSMVTLVPMMGLHYDSGRKGTNIRVLSLVFFIFFSISHLCFVGFGVSMPYYIMVNGIMLLVYLALFYIIEIMKNC